MMSSASAKTDTPSEACSFELAVRNADKGSIDVAEVERLLQVTIDFF